MLGTVASHCKLHSFTEVFDHKDRALAVFAFILPAG